MRNLKKFLALVMAMVMAMSLMVSANALHAGTQYGDETAVTPAFDEAVQVLTGMGVYSGDSGNFKPGDDITRAEVAALIYRLVTGDTTDARKGLYDEYPYGGFTDIPRGAWYGGYVGYCANADLIKGRSSTTFDPSGKVTGYEVLAMVLRAVGYDKNGEFTGSDWRVNVSATAQQLGILDNVKTTQYGGTLYLPARRDVVADLLFRTAAYVNMVNYTPAFGYQPYGDPNSQWNDLTGGQVNNTLGQKVFGLNARNGIVVGNQATGETKTLLGITGSSIGTPGVAVKDPYGNDVKYIIDDDKGTASDTSDDDLKFIYRYTDNDATKGLNSAYDKTTAANKAGAQVAVMVYYGTNAPISGSNYDGYAYANNMRFSFKTGLNMFGHAARVWYDDTTSVSGYTTYAILDKAYHTAYVYAEDDVLSENAATNDNTKAQLGQAAIDAGFYVQRDTSKSDPTTAHFSDRYSQMSAGTFSSVTTAGAAGNKSPIKTYALVSNNSDKEVDVVIALSAEVGKIAEKNTTAATPYLTLGNSADDVVSTFTNHATATDRIWLDNLTPDTKEEQKQTGALVTAYQIVGTNFTLTSALTISGANWGKVLYQLDPMKTETITVATYGSPASPLTINTATPVITHVTPTGGTTIGLSGIVNGDSASAPDGKIISRALPIAVNDTDAAVTTLNTDAADLANNLKAGLTYTAYIDLVGRFISLVPATGTRFLYGTYAGYELDGYDAGTIKYNMVGVGWDAAKQTENNIKYISNNTPTEDTSPINGNLYATNIAVTKKDQGQVTASGQTGNEIKTGVNTGYMYNATTGSLYAGGLDGTAFVNEDKWTFTSDDATRGFARVKGNQGATAANQIDYLVTNDTEFIIVTGTGTATLKVDTVKGITGLLAGGTSADIYKKTATTTNITSDMNNVYFQTYEDLFGTTSTSNNHTVVKVILSDGNLTRWNAQTLYFNYTATGTTAPTGAKLAGAGTRNIEQFALWNNGQLGYYFIDLDASLTTASTPTAWTASANVEVQTFYTLAKMEEINGVEVFRAVALNSPTGVDYLTGYNSKQGGTAVVYNYVTVNNLSTALLKKGTPESVYSIGSDIIVCDVQYKTVAVTANTREEITSVRELNNAVSVRQSNASTAFYADIEVAVVYEGSVISCIYVTSVPTVAP